MGLLRGSPDERLVHASMGEAVERVIAQVDGEGDRGRVEVGLRLCFTRAPEADSSQGLRAAVVEQVALLRGWAETIEPSSPFYDTVEVEPDWLENAVADAFVAALEAAVVSSSPAALVDHVRHEQLTGTLAELRELLLAVQGTPAPARRVMVGVVPLAADCFQEREAAARIDRELEKDGGVVLSGMGGIGKTQLAAAHARASKAEVVVWATAATRQGIVDAYADAATRLCLPGVGENPERDVARFLEWMASTSTSWLVVLDDIRDPADVARLRPPTDTAGQVLATTRRRDSALSGQGRRRLDIDLYTAAEARSYLAAKLAAESRTEPNADLDALADDLGRLPLALAQAAAYVIDTCRTIAVYRHRFADHKRQLEELVPEVLPDDHRYIVAAAWTLSVEQADQARPAGFARPLLELLSVLDPNGVPQQILSTSPALAYLGGAEPDDVHDALRVLHRFSLATHDLNADGREIRVHQLIQRATRDTLTAGQATSTTHTVADALYAAWPEVENGSLGGILRANTAALVSVTDDALWQWQGMVHPVLFIAAHSLGKTGQVRAAVDAYENLFTRTFQHYGPDHPITHTARANLATWQGEAGDAAGAVAAFTDLLDKVRNLVPENPLTFSIRNSLAYWQGQAGDAAGAVAAFTDLLADQLRILGPDDPSTLTVRNNLVRWRGEAGDAAGAASAAEELLADRIRVLGPDHPSTLITRNNLMFWRGKAGDATGAVAGFEELLADRIRVLGPEHPATLTVRNNVMLWRGIVGDAAGAAAAAEELLADQLRILGPDHPDTLTAQSNLANFRAETGDVEGAVAAFTDLLADQLRILGPDHPDTLTAQNNLARWRGEAGDAAGAIAAYTDLLADQLRILGPDHPDTLTTRNNLLVMQGEFADAEDAAVAAEELLADLIRVMGSDHPYTLTARNNLARWRGEAGDAAGAIAAYTDLLADQLRILGPDHPDTLITRNNLAHWQGEAGDPAGAVVAFSALIADLVRILGPEHRHTLTARNSLTSMRERVMYLALAQTMRPLT